MTTVKVSKMRNYKLYRWWKGGLWVKHDDSGWVHGRWSSSGTGEEYIYDERNCCYHKTLRGILTIEDYTG